MGVIATIPPLFENQVQSLAFEESQERVADFSDPGTGKTRVRLEGFAKRRARGAKCMLVLAPKSLLHSAWSADCRRYTPWLSTSCAYADNREKAFERKADIYITNHDAVKWLAKQPPAFFARFDELVIDESGAFKHHTSQRSKAISRIKKYFKRRTIMNGTPNPNTILDVWHQVNILDDGARLGKSFFAFRGAVCTPEQVGPASNMLKWHDRENSEVFVADRLKDIVIRHKLRECMDIPDNFAYVTPFRMAQKHDAKYREMEELAALQVKGGMVTAVNAAALVTKLLQIASGAVYDEEGKYHVVSRDRYELVADLADERRHVVVFFNWVHQRDLLVEEFKKRQVTHTIIDGSVTPKRRIEAVNAYQAGMYRVLLAHPQSAAHGLTLTKGTRTIWASPTYNLEHWIQGNHRIDRAGQTEKTETANIIAEGTIEEHVYRVLTEKRTRLQDMLEYLRK
jgi:SNF2 family DNA or RNA helicase